MKNDEDMREMIASTFATDVLRLVVTANSSPSAPEEPIEPVPQADGTNEGTSPLIPSINPLSMLGQAFQLLSPLHHPECDDFQLQFLPRLSFCVTEAMLNPNLVSFFLP